MANACFSINRSGLVFSTPSTRNLRPIVVALVWADNRGRLNPSIAIMADHRDDMPGGAPYYGLLLTASARKGQPFLPARRAISAFFGHRCSEEGTTHRAGWARV